MQIRAPIQDALRTQLSAFEPPATWEPNARVEMPRRGLLSSSGSCRLSTIGPPNTISVAIEGRCRFQTNANPVKIQLECQKGRLKSESTTNPGSDVNSRFLFLSGVTGTQVTVTGGEDALECTESNGDIREYDLEKGTSKVRKGPVEPTEEPDGPAPARPKLKPKPESEPSQPNTRPQPASMRNSVGRTPSLGTVLLSSIVLGAAALY